MQRLKSQKILNDELCERRLQGQVNSYLTKQRKNKVKLKKHLKSIIEVLQITHLKTPFMWKCLGCSIVKIILHRNFVRRQISPYK